MDSIKQITTKGLQSHRDLLVFDFPATGIIRFRGNNSNGKSVITKTLEDCISNAINNKKKRKSLVNRESPYGEITIRSYNGKYLLVHISRDAAQTYATLQIGDEPPITRYLADKSIPQLIRAFGWHYNKDRDISLNICDNESAVLFMKTNYATNYDIFDSGVTDYAAKNRYDELEKVYKTTQEIKKTTIQQLAVDKAAYEQIRIYDINKEQEKIDALTKLQVLEYMEPLPELPILRGLPNRPILQVLDINIPILHGDLNRAILSDYEIDLPVLHKVVERPILKVRFINIPHMREVHYMDTSIELPDVVDLCRKITAIEEGVCPTCGREYCSHQTCTNEI